MKIILAFCAFFVLLSCSNSDDATNSIDPTLLSKYVILSSNPDNIMHWNFNDDGLLAEITKADGTQLYSFAYDSDDRLVLITTYGTPTTIQTFSYDSTGHVNAVAGYPVTYDAAANKYVLEYVQPVGEDPYDYPFASEVVLNSEGLPISSTVYHNTPESPVGYSWFTMNYQNANMMRYWNSMDMEFNFTYDSHPNPLKQALLPITKVIALTSASYPSNLAGWGDGKLTSENNVVHLAYASEDPESTVVTYDYNANNLPVTQTNQQYYFGEIDGSPTVVNQYYYQGDIIP